MNKVIRILLALGLVLALAAPAFAEFKFNGYYRLMGYSAGLKTTDDENGDTRQTVYQRFRGQLTYTLNDNVSLVYFAEVDTDWGSQSKGSIGNGGSLGADGVNVETKNVYLDLKFDNATARLGVQTINDQFQGVVFYDDMSAANATYKMNNTTLHGLWSKWYEVDSSLYDDTDLYGAEVNQKFSDNFNAGAAVYFLQDNSARATNSADDLANNSKGETEVYFYGLNADWKSGDFGVNGFAIFEDGKFNYNDNANKDDVNMSAWAASVKGTYKLANGDLGLRVIYFSKDSDEEDNDGWYMFQRDTTGNTNGYEFINENQMYFLVDKFVTDHPKERYALVDAAAAGFGLWGVVLSGNHKLPQDYYLNWGAGYYRALDDERNDGAAQVGSSTTWSTFNYRDGKTLGYEIDARFGKKFFEKVDLSLNAAYAAFGSFYDKSVNTTFTTDRRTGQIIDANGDDPNAIYKVYVMVNVPF